MTQKCAKDMPMSSSTNGLFLPKQANLAVAHHMLASTM